MVTRQDRAWHYERNRLESSCRKDGNGKGSNVRKGKNKKRVDRKGALAGKVEGLSSGKEQETFKEEEKQSVTKGGLPKAVRKLIGRVMDWENDWEEEEELVVRELGRRKVAEKWSMREEALVKERRVTGRESTTFVCVLKNSIPVEPCLIQPFSSYLDSAKCNLDKNTKAA